MIEKFKKYIKELPADKIEIIDKLVKKENKDEFMELLKDGIRDKIFQDWDNFEIIISKDYKQFKKRIIRGINKKQT